MAEGSAFRGGGALDYDAGDPRARTLVTLDGPAGVGKSTTARAVARVLGYRYLDSGALYRAVTCALLRSSVAPEAWSELTPARLEALGVQVLPAASTLEIRLDGVPLGPELRTLEVTERVPAAARIPAVRRWLLGAQRAAAVEGRLVADGRDMGTVVFPQAWTKVFLVADIDERARRRLGDRGVEHPDLGQVRAEAARLAARDRQDRERAVAPLRKPEGALVLDTTRLGFQEQVDRIVAYAREVARRRAPPGPAAP
ncbi:MAG: (d)CMP kinase [Longimicrobiales bacterium]|nr:(d)CMP kinase [Longimicrobiales bacterium]